MQYMSIYHRAILPKYSPTIYLFTIPIKYLDQKEAG